MTASPAPTSLADPSSHVSRGAWPLLARAFAAMPRGALTWLGALLGFFAGVVLRVRRAHVEAAMRRAGIEDAAGRARAMYRALGASACEFLWLAVGAPRKLDEVVTIEPKSRLLLERVLERGNGAILAASHTGNWDLAACAVASRAPLLVVTKHLHAKTLDAFWQSTRAAYGVSLADAAGATRAAREGLARGGLVAMMIDQVPCSARHAVRESFLGEDAYVDRAPATMAARAGVPLVVCASRRLAPWSHELSILEVIEPPGAQGRAAWIEHATRHATQALERFVLRHPSEWLWLHRRWKAPVDARAALK